MREINICTYIHTHIFPIHRRRGMRERRKRVTDKPKRTMAESLGRALLLRRVSIRCIPLQVYFRARAGYPSKSQSALRTAHLPFPLFLTSDAVVVHIVDDDDNDDDDRPRAPNFHARNFSSAISTLTGRQPSETSDERAATFTTSFLLFLVTANTHASAGGRDPGALGSFWIRARFTPELVSFFVPPELSPVTAVHDRGRSAPAFPSRLVPSYLSRTSSRVSPRVRTGSRRAERLPSVGATDQLCTAYRPPRCSPRLPFESIRDDRARDSIDPRANNVSLIFREQEDRGQRRRHESRRKLT